MQQLELNMEPETQWEVTKMERYSEPPQLVFRLKGTEGKLARVVFNGSGRATYEWDGWSLQLDPKYRAGVDRALVRFLEEQQKEN